jgi:hypothetical protein
MSILFWTHRCPLWISDHGDRAQGQGFQCDPASLARFRPGIPQFSAETNANGIAIVKGSPAGQQTFFVQSDSFDMPIQSDQPRSTPGEMPIARHMGTIAVTSAAGISAQIKMESKG